MWSPKIKAEEVEFNEVCNREPQKMLSNRNTLKIIFEDQAGRLEWEGWSDNKEKQRQIQDPSLENAGKKYKHLG